MARRQAKIYGLLIALLAAVLAVALLGLTGAISLPFGDEFSKKIDYATFGDTPCPPEKTKPDSAEGAQLQVLNASSTSGLAGEVAASLEALGYQFSLIDNSPDPFRGNVQIEAGPEGIPLAYTLARYFDDPIRIRLRDLPGKTVTIIIGEGFQGILTPEQLTETHASTAVLQGLPECKILNTEKLSPTDEPDEQSGTQQEQSGTQSE